MHKKTHTICLGGPAENRAVVCIEDLKVANMSRSASGSQASPGKNVRAKSGLNRAILDQEWGEFRRQLGYKLDWVGGELIVLPAQYTSQQCSCCGHIAKENRNSQAGFCCQAHPGAVTLILRFGSALNLTLHFHVPFIDGVYSLKSNGELRFHGVIPPRAKSSMCWSQ